MKIQPIACFNTLLAYTLQFPLPDSGYYSLGSIRSTEHSVFRIFCLNNLTSLCTKEISLEYKKQESNYLGLGLYNGTIFNVNKHQRRNQKNLVVKANRNSVISTIKIKFMSFFCAIKPT